MKDFAKNFLNQDWTAMPNAPRFYLSGFGKHPGWNDHLDDIGLVTPSLINARAMLYDGMAHQIESAAWEKAGPDKVVPGFDHVIHWRRLNESLTGRMRSSRDGKGRTLYPMVTLAHCVGQPFSWQAAEVLPALEETGVKCRATTVSNSVVAILNAAQESLRARLPTLVPATSDGPEIGVREWAGHFSREPEALRRVLHHLQANFAAFAPGNPEWCKNKRPSQVHSRCLRLPLVPGAQPAESLNAWMSFLTTQFDPAVPLLGLLRVGRTWLDVIVGEPGLADLFLLRTMPTVTPLVSDIPYQLTASPSAHDARVTASLARGALPDISCFNGSLVGSNQVAAANWLNKGRLNFISRMFRSSASPF